MRKGHGIFQAIRNWRVPDRAPRTSVNFQSQTFVEYPGGNTLLPLNTMKYRLLSFALFLVIASVPGFSAQGKHTPMEDQMEEINAVYRKLGRQIKDPAKNADSLKQAGIIREHAIAATKMEPKRKADVPAAEQAKFISEYQSAMKAFVDEIGKLEAALKAGKNEEAAAALQALKVAQENGHRDFRRRKVTFEEKAAEAARRNEEK